MTELEIKAAVRERDGYRCTDCGMTSDEHYARYGRELEVHRLIPGSPYTIEGSVTRCKPCHGKAHRLIRGVFKKATVKVHRDIVRKARTIAAFRSVSVAVLLNRLLKPIIDREFALFSRQLD